MKPPGPPSVLQYLFSSAPLTGTLWSRTGAVFVCCQFKMNEGIKIVLSCNFSNTVRMSSAASSILHPLYLQSFFTVPNVLNRSFLKTDRTRTLVTIIHALRKVVRVKENNVAHPKTWVTFVWVVGSPQTTHMVISYGYKFREQ